MKTLPWNLTSAELLEAIEGQQTKLLNLARRINPRVTSDDILQPNDFPELEEHPEFRYEEGVLHGLFAAEALLRRCAHEKLPFIPILLEESVFDKAKVSKI